MSLLVLNYLNLAELSPAETVIAAGQGGFKAAGVRLTAHRRGELGPDIVTDEGALADLRKKASDSGVTIATMSTYRFLPDTNVADYGPVLEAGAALGVTTMAVNCFTPDEPLAVDNLATVAEAAAAFEIKLALEFIPVSSVKTIADAARVMTATGQRNVGINVDALHLHRSGGSPEDLHKIDPALIHSVHLCDVPLAAPADLFAEMRSGRLYQGKESCRFTNCSTRFPEASSWKWRFRMYVLPIFLQMSAPAAPSTPHKPSWRDMRGGAGQRQRRAALPSSLKDS